MLTINDYSNLSPAEAREKAVQLQHRIFTEQFNSRFFIRDPRPEYYLRYEITAWYEGRISEFHGWTDPLGQALRYIYDKLISYLYDLWRDTMRPWIEWVLNKFSRLWDSAVTWAYGAYNRAVDIWNRLVDIHYYIRSTIYSTLQSIWHSLYGIGTTVTSAVRLTINVVWSWIQQGASWVYQQITNVVLPYIRQHYLLLLGPVGIILDNVRGLFPQLNTIWNSITSTVSGVFETLSQQVAALPQAIGAAFQSAVSYIRDVLEAVWNDVLVPFGQGLAEGLQWIASQFEQAFITVWDSFQGILASVAPVTPEKGQDLGFTLLKIAGLSAGGLLAMSAAWDLVHPFKDVIPGELKAMLYDVTNFKMILGALSGALVTAAIAQPAKYSYNALLRPYLPGWGDVMELRSRAFISDDEFLRMMRYHGYDDSWKPWFDELANTPVRYFGLAAVARTGYYDDQFFREELDRSGYSARAKEVMLQMYQQTANEALRGMYSSVAVRRYRAGIIDDGGLNSELQMLGYPEQQRKPIIQGAQLYYDLDTVEDYVDALRYSYRRGKITIDELRAGLAALGIRGDRIQRITGIELARAKEDVGSTQEEEVRAYGRGTVVRRYREGVITDADLANELQMLGYSPQWIERLKQVARLERDYDFAMTVLSYTKTAYRKRIIDDTRFINILRSYGFTDEKIMLELSLIKLAYGIGLTEEDIAA